MKKIIKRLKDEEALIRCNVRQIRTGGLEPQRRNKWRKLEDRIVRLKDQYHNGTLTIDEY